MQLVTDDVCKLRLEAPFHSILCQQVSKPHSTVLCRPTGTAHSVIRRTAFHITTNNQHTARPSSSQYFVMLLVT